ncbi:hypothetical protein ACJIZ3_019895 [Penstemon smallii]|uniref:Transposase n=1 Tax=Penstemon smallii TaxID=265156 RepID=A0ABD3T411_9LAMI
MTSLLKDVTLMNLKIMLNKAKRSVPRMQKIIVDEESSRWYSDPDDDEDISNLTDLDNTMHKHPHFRAGETMKNRELVVCMKFDNIKVYRQALKDWAVRQGYELEFVKNERKRVTAVCKADGCNWRIHASAVQGAQVFQIKTITGEHTCARSTTNKHATSKYLGMRLEAAIKDNPDVSILKLKNSILRKSGKVAMDKIKGQDAMEYGLLWDYCETVRIKNPGSKLLLRKTPDSDPPIFERMYFSLAAMKFGFISGCRPLIGLDGCFLKTPHGGQLLCAVGRDGNDNLFPIALAVVPIENRETWTWFVSELLDDIGGVEDNKWIFISDRQKGLLETIKALAPRCAHRFFLRHLYQNFKTKWPSLEMKFFLWRAASTTNRNEFNSYMKEIENLDPKIDPKIETAS